MKYLVHLSMPIRNGINGDNLRGEARTERNMLAALLAADREIYLTDVPEEIWKSGSYPKNLHSYSELDSIENTTYIYHTAPSKVIFFRQAKYYVLQCFNPHIPTEKQKILDLIKENPGRVLITTSFKTNIDIFKQWYGKDNVVLIEGPAVPDNLLPKKSEDPNYLLWSSRTFYNYINNDPKGMWNLFYWCNSQLVKNPNLKVAITTVNSHSTQTSEEWFWSLEASKHLLGVKDRIELYQELSWEQMLELYSKTKLIISPADAGGGPIYEAPIYKIPIVVNYFCPYTFSGIISAKPGLNSDFITHLDRLISNQNYYTTTSELYYNYVKSNVSYSAWIKNLEIEITKRGWI